MKRTKNPQKKQFDLMKDQTPVLIVFLIILVFVSLSTAFMYRIKYLDTTKQAPYPLTTWQPGDIVTGDGFIYNLTSIRTDTQSIPKYWELDANSVFLLVRLSLKNTSTQVLEFSPVSTMQVRDESGATHEVSSAPGIRDSLGGPINPGQTVSGEVGFTVPKTMNSGFVIYAPAQAGQHIITTAISLP
jgi:hypothetical protein